MNTIKDVKYLFHILLLVGIFIVW